jgi:protein phosphatase 1B
LYRRIPLEFYGMGAFLDKPKTDKHNETGHGNGLRFGVSTMQGWRVEMEDAHCAVTQLPGHLSGWSFFAVFDGHAGARVSEQCATQLLEAIVRTNQFSHLDPEIIPTPEQIRTGIREGFLTLDEQLRRIPELESGEDKSGSTAVCVLVSPTQIYFANCGDSRAVLVRNGEVLFSTTDHKPVNPTERERIQNAGGSVMIQRVNGSLAVSRSLGDYDYKRVEGRGPTEQLVSPEPEITAYDRHSQDQFIVLACDGVWDVMTNEDLNTYIQHRLRVSEDLSKVCNEVVDNCLYKGSRDNMSIVLIAFEGAPQIDPAFAEKDLKLDEEIKTQTARFLSSNPDTDMGSLISFLNSQDFKNFPPGGIITKRHLIDALYEDHMKKCSIKQ